MSLKMHPTEAEARQEAAQQALNNLNVSPEVSNVSPEVSNGSPEVSNGGEAKNGSGASSGRSGKGTGPSQQNHNHKNHKNTLINMCRRKGYMSPVFDTRLVKGPGGGHVSTVRTTDVEGNLLEATSPLLHKKKVDAEGVASHLALFMLGQTTHPPQGYNDGEKHGVREYPSHGFHGDSQISHPTHGYGYPPYGYNDGGTRVAEEYPSQGFHGDDKMSHPSHGSHGNCEPKESESNESAKSGKRKRPASSTEDLQTDYKQMLIEYTQKMWYPMPAFSFSDSFLNHDPHEVGKYYGYGYVSVNGVVYKSPIKTPDRLKSEQLAAEKALAMLGVIKAPDRLKSEQFAAEKAVSMLGVVKKARKEDTPDKPTLNLPPSSTFSSYKSALQEYCQK